MYVSQGMEQDPRQLEIDACAEPVKRRVRVSGVLGCDAEPSGPHRAPNRWYGWASRRGQRWCRDGNRALHAGLAQGGRRRHGFSHEVKKVILTVRLGDYDGGVCSYRGIQVGPLRSHRISGLLVVRLYMQDRSIPLIGGTDLFMGN